MSNAKQPPVKFVTISVPICDIREAIECMEYHANMEAGQTQAPDLCTEEDYQSWEIAQRWREAFKSLGV